MMRTRVMLFSSAFMLMLLSGLVASGPSEAAPAPSALAPLQLIDKGSNPDVQKVHSRRFYHCHRRSVRRCWGRHCRWVVSRNCHRR